MRQPADNALHYPFPTAPEPGGVLTVAPGVLWIRLALPYQLDHINVWALDGGHPGGGPGGGHPGGGRTDKDAGWTLVDTGLGDERTFAVWEGLLATRLAGRPVERVVVTHFHPDHIGAADWLVRRTGAGFAASLAEWLLARVLAGPGTPAAEAAVECFYRRGGLDGDTLAAVLARKGTYAYGVPGVPMTLTRLRAGNRLRVGATEWRVLGGSGHSVEPVSLHDPAAGLLIAGDQILPRISPNVSVWPNEPDADPLTDYFASLDAWSALPADTLVLPSHGVPFHGLHARAAALRDHHTARLEDIVRHCAAPQTAIAVTRSLFHRPLDSHQMVFALGEAIAHLNHLIGRGLLERDDGPDGVDRYRRRTA